ncbi:MAG: hypothetical protein JXB48_12520 [Candidatus Latescibacteria bacterium]|nr:hypothetical protein [Candidatus Latescibacterota bacterium]
MKFVRNILLFVFMVLLVVGSSTVFAQQNERRGGDPTQRLVRIFEEAKCPLSADQISKIQKLEPGENYRKELGEILNDDQKKAYREAMRRFGAERPQGGERRSFGEMIANTLQEAGHPLTDEQKEKINKIEPGPNSREAYNEILTQEQRDALKEGMARRGSQFFIQSITRTLEEGGKPLTEEQTKKLQELEQGPDMREKMAAILTEEQNKILEASRQNRRGQRDRQQQ